MKRLTFWALCLAILLQGSLVHAWPPGGNGGGKPPKDDPPPPEPPPIEYVLSTFPTLGGRYALLNGINQSGDAVGYSQLEGDQIQHAIVVPVDADGYPLAMIDLNDVIDVDDGWELNGAYDINESGQVVGWGTRYPAGDELPYRLTPPADAGLVQQADGTYRFEDGDGNVVFPDVISLGLLPGTFSGTGFGINVFGDVVGDNWVTGGGRIAFLYTDEFGLMPLAADLGNDARQVQAVNDFLEITGEMSSGAFPEAHRYSVTSGTLEPLGVLSPGDNPESTGWDINNSGTVAGTSTFTIVRKGPDLAGRRAFRFRDGVMEDLGTLGGNDSLGLGINSHNDVVGTAGVSAYESAGFLYSDALGGMLNLDALIVNPINQSIVPRRIADNGVICGNAAIEVSGQYSLPIILTPILED